MKKKKKDDDLVIGSTEFNAWMKQIERELWWESMMGYLPGFGVVLFIIFLLLSLSFDWTYLGLIATFVSLAVALPVLIPWDSFEKKESHEVIKYERKEVHHHHHHNIGVGPKRVTEIKEVRARLPNGTEVSVRQGRKYE